MKKIPRYYQKLLRLMRITLTQIIIAGLFTSLSYASPTAAQKILEQKINLTVEDKPLSEVLSMIEKTAEVRFSYLPKQIQADKKMTFRCENEPLRVVLDKFFKKTPINYEVIGIKQILLSKGRTPQYETSEIDIKLIGASHLNAASAAFIVTGVVADEKGEPLVGASVVLEGTQRGTLTDINGAYKLELAEEDKNGALIFSFVGYEKQRLPMNGQTTINVTLKESNALNEVVVVGYGTQSRRNVTGSVSKVDMKQLQNLPITNLSQAMRGRVAGVQFNDNGRPGQGGNILVRGQRSITASNNPLIILDGIFFEGNLNDINPGDIESMEVLKDASATAIYGARAANGVILVTSKKGTSEKPIIRFSSLYGTSQWGYKPKLLTPERYLQKVLDWRTQAGLVSDPTKVADYLDATEKKNYLAGNTVEPWDLVSQNANLQNYDLSVAGRSEKVNYFISANYNIDKGLIYNDNAKRTSLRINLENQIFDWFKIGTNSQYTERDLSGVNGSVTSAYWTTPFVSPWLDEAKTDPNPFPTEDQLAGPVLFNAINNKDEEKNRNLFANFYAKIDVPFIKGLAYRVNYSPNFRWFDFNAFSPIYRRNGVNNLGSASRRSDFNRTWVLENIVTYNKDINRNNAIDITLLYGRNQSFNRSLTASGTDFTDVSDANGWNNLSLAKVQTTASNASQVDAISSMARLNYRFKNRYLLTVTARRDGNSVFGQNNKFGIFPSVAAAWIMSDEPFMKNMPNINVLKLRASYGSVGNQAVSPYQSLIRQSQSQYVFGDGGTTSVGLFPANMANPSLTWETTTTTNLALDFEMFKSRIGGTIELYNLNTKDLLLNRQLPTPTGFRSILTNVGATNNKGVEVTLNTVNVRKGELEWNSSVAFSTNINKIVNLYRSDINNDGQEDNDIGNSWFIGQPIQVIYDYTFDGIYQANDQVPVGQKVGFVKMKDLNGDGKINADDRSVIGNRDAKYRWSLTNNVKYKNFNLLIMVNSLMGWQAPNYLGALSERIGETSGNFPSRVTNFLDLGWWTADNKSNVRPSLVYTNPLASAAEIIESRDFVRLQEVALSYNIPNRLLNNWKINNLSVFVSARNLYTLTKWTGMDPESGYNDRGNMFPTPRTTSFGFSLSF